MYLRTSLVVGKTAAGGGRGGLISIIVFLLSLLSLIVSGQIQSKVAIIGGGIGGASCAHYLAQISNGTIETVLFEASDYIGGRLKTATIRDGVFEIGGDAWASPNVVMQELAAYLNISLSKKSSRMQADDTGIWLGYKNWTTPDSSISLDSLKLLLSMTQFTDELRLDYDEYYLVGSPFTDPKDFFYPFNMGIGESMNEFVSNIAFHEVFVEKDIIPVIRAIYDQQLEVNVFAGLVSLVPLFTDNYSVQGGNNLLVKGLLNKAGTKILLGTTVNTVTKLSNGQYELSYHNTSSRNLRSTAIFDAIFVATPLESSMGLQFLNIPPFTFPMREYRHWFVTLVAADGLNPNFFGIDPVPNNILTTDTSNTNFTIPFVVLSLQGTAGGQNVYKTFSELPIDTYINQMYINVTEVKSQYWPHTFPSLAPLSTYQPILLDNHIYYLNTMESAATAMEASALAGKNAATYFKKQLFSSSHTIQ